MQRRSLHQVIEQYPFADYADWWPLGERFVTMISHAIMVEWRQLDGNDGDSTGVWTHYAEYLHGVYARSADPAVVNDFAMQRNLSDMQSGEFDALSYAFFRTAFELIERNPDAYSVSTAQARRWFTQQVGRRFFFQLHEHLKLDLPESLESGGDLSTLQKAVDRVGDFLVDQGYLRDHFAFRFDVDVVHGGRRITQESADFVSRLAHTGLGYALYEMGYPVILPSAVYLYQIMGEAQHHSSRIFEELFRRVDCIASETDDFNPTGYPSELVVELWEIRPEVD